MPRRCSLQEREQQRAVQLLRREAAHAQQPQTVAAAVEHGGRGGAVGNRVDRQCGVPQPIERRPPPVGGRVRDRDHRVQSRWLPARTSSTWAASVSSHGRCSVRITARRAAAAAGTSPCPSQPMPAWTWISSAGEAAIDAGRVRRIEHLRGDADGRRPCRQRASGGVVRPRERRHAGRQRTGQGEHVLAHAGRLGAVGHQQAAHRSAAIIPAAVTASAACLSRRRRCSVSAWATTWSML